MLKAFCAAAAAIATIATPVAAASAAPACWNGEETAAATIREFQSLLMVATLRCQVAHHDMTTEYNDFLRANKSLIQRQNDRLKAHFIRAGGAAAGQKAYDSFTTHLANGYGAEGSSPELCDTMASLAREATLMAGNIDALLLLAERQGLATQVPGGSCAAPRQTVARQTVALNGGRTVAAAAADH